MPNYQSVLSNFDSDYSFFVSAPKKARGRKPKNISEIFPEFAGFDEGLFGSFGGGIVDTPQPSKPITPTVNLQNVFSGSAGGGNGFDIDEIVFEGTILEGDISDVILTAADAVQDLINDYEPYDYGNVVIRGIDNSGAPPTGRKFYIESENPIAYESGWVELDDLVDDLENAGIDPDESQFYDKYWDTNNQDWGELSKNFVVEVMIAKNPGTGDSALKIQSVKDLRLKKSVVCINNKDDLCLFRCIAIAIAKQDNHPQLKQIVSGRKIQTEITDKLCDMLGIRINKGLETIKYIEGFLDCSITIIDSNNFLNVSYPDIESDTYEPKDWNIYLLKTDNHFDYINSNMIAGFFGRKYYCGVCKKSYENKDSHKKNCISNCNICKGKFPECDCVGYTSEDYKKIGWENWFKCEDCGRNFPSQKCFDSHKINHILQSGKNKGDAKPSICESMYKCGCCKETMYDLIKFPKDEHKCGDYWCKNCNCKANRNTGHKCYMMPKPIKNHSTDYIFFDFEAEQETGEHNVNYSISEYFDDDEKIEHFNLDDMCNWLFQEKHKGYSVIAHNGRGYDFQFIMKWIYKNTVYKPKVVYAGSKIMIMKIKELKMTFVDSLNFLTMRLADFPKTFGIKELKKGYFPHFFNTKRNFRYIGKIPPMKYFGIDNMRTKERTEFIKWWVAKRATNYKWNEYEEMKSYCISDVDILKRCCKKFREQYIEIADIDPFQYTTIASVCMAIFRSDCIVDDFAENYPHQVEDGEGGLRPGTTVEKKDYMNKMRLVVQDEAKIAILPYAQQQFIRRAFFGGRTNAAKLKHTFKGTEEGIYSDITSLYPSVNFFDDYPMGHPDDLKYKVKNITSDDYYKIGVDDDGKKIMRHKSLDYFKNPRDYFGFIECDIKCPKNLYHPVLPHKGKKLFFSLDDKIGGYDENKNYVAGGVWATPEINKALDLGYEIVRINRVLHFKEKGNNLFKKYVSKFLKVKQEASGYPSWVLLPYKDHEGKLKWTQQDADKQELESMKYSDIETKKNHYINQYLIKQQVKLDADEIVFNPTLKDGKIVLDSQGNMMFNLKGQQNPGKRAIAKLCLNSLWGKFGQRINMPKTEIIGSDNKKKFQEIMFDKEKYKNKNVNIIDSNRLEISYTLNDNHVEETTDTNIAIAAFTTSHARMRLYWGLEKLGEQVLYFDTDSVVYKYDKNNPDHTIIANGDYLGDWTDELDGTKMCGVFISGGPKNYSYETDDGEHHTKIKGFTLNHKSTRPGKLNHNSMINMIDNYMEGKVDNNWVQVSYNMISRDKKTKTLKTYTLKKKYGFSYDKRHICPADADGNIDSLPFGHQDLSE